MELNLYLLGGASTRLADVFLKLLDDDEAPEISHIRYIDVSESDLDVVPEDPRVELFSITTGVPGSGGVRGTHNDSMAEQVPGLLDSMKIDPTSINVLISNFSGATGTMLSYYIADYLAERNIPVIVAFSYEDSSILRINNTMKAIESIESLSQDHYRIIPTIRRKIVDGNFEEIDAKLASDILLILSGLLQSGSIDETDIRNMIAPHNIPDVFEIYGPGLVDLHYLTHEKEPDTIGASILTHLHLNTLGTNTSTISPMAGFTGIINEMLESRYRKMDICTVDTSLPDVLEALSKRAVAVRSQFALRASGKRRLRGKRGAKL